MISLKKPDYNFIIGLIITTIKFISLQAWVIYNLSQDTPYNFM